MALDAYGQTEANAAVYQVEGYPPNVVKIIPPEPPLPIEPGGLILAGEAIQSLRTALDYLIYDLAILDSGEPKTGTHFPAESDPEAFDNHNPHTPKRTKPHTCPNCGHVTTRVVPKTDYLKGLNLAHVTAIEELQPYKAGKWIGDLITLSNPDKHRDFVVLDRGLELSATTKWGEVGCFDRLINSGLIPESAIARAYTDGGSCKPIDVRVHVDFSHFVTFENGSRVLDTLDEFILKTEEVLEAFKPEFK